MNLSIIGLGYVGTVTAACLAGQGHHVWGVDINPEKVRLVGAGRSPIVEPGLEARLRDANEAGRLRATCNVEEALGDTGICFVSVATPSRENGQVDPTHLLRACDQIANALVTLQRRQIVVIRSSVLPPVFDACRHLFESKAPGLVDLCANPEFLREGSALRDFEQPAFTIIGTESAIVERALRDLYGDLPAPTICLKPKEALMVKYASNAFHALKVAFANEIAAVCDQDSVDPETVMRVFCADQKLNISERYLMPGFAFGGSCLPKDVRALAYAGRACNVELPLISAILRSNTEVIERAFQRIRRTGARHVALVGLSFKPSTDDLRESPFVELAERLIGKGCELKIYDPNVMVSRLTGANKEYIDRTIAHLSRLLVPKLNDLSGAELVVVGHRFDGVNDWLAQAAKPIIDLACPGITRLAGEASAPDAQFQ